MSDKKANIHLPGLRGCPGIDLEVSEEAAEAFESTHGLAKFQAVMLDAFGRHFAHECNHMIMTFGDEDTSTERVTRV